MSNIKKRQHYVWRYYLKPWADNESIWTYFKESDKIKKPNLKRVAQEKYFYKLTDFNNKEEEFLKKFINYKSPEVVKYLNFYFLELFIIPYKLRKRLETNKNTLIDKDCIAKEISKLEINLMEEAQCKMEGFGSKLLRCGNLDDLKSLDKDELLKSIIFLCFKYSRTRNIKESVLQQFKGDSFEKFSEMSWNIISYLMAIRLARSISTNRNLKFIFIENNTNNHFLKGDQPIFNILNDKLNENGELTDFELYYPITPKHSLSIHFCPTQNEKFENKIADAEMINYLNKKVIENSYFYVFADSKEQLEKLKQLDDFV